MERYGEVISATRIESELASAPVSATATTKE
jgi:hypothetical protein